MVYDVVFSWCKSDAFRSSLLAVVIVFFQAIYVNIITDEFRIQGDRNWLPGMFYALTASALPDFLFLSPPLVAVSFVLIAMRRLFSTYQTPNTAGVILESAFWTGVAALFYPQAVFLMIAAFIGLNVMRSFVLKEQITFIVGAIMPLYLAFTVFFWYDMGGFFLHDQVSNLIGWFHLKPLNRLSSILKVSLLALFVLAILLNISNITTKKLIHTQKIITILLWFMLIAGLSAVLQGDMLPSHFLLIMPTIGILFGVIFTNIKNKRIAEILHLLLMGSILFIQYAP